MDFWARTSGDLDLDSDMDMGLGLFMSVLSWNKRSLYYSELGVYWRKRLLVGRFDDTTSTAPRD